MASYSYAGCIEQAYKVNWKIKDVLAAGEFDLRRPWLPPELSAGSGIFCLNQEERLKLTHVEMGAYAHLFGFLEAFIAPLMVDLALDAEQEGGEAFEALTNFASEEVKHMHLFREVRKQVDAMLGFPLDLIGDASEIAHAVLARNRGAVLLLTDAIEWFTQYHYLSAMKDSDALDPLTREIFRCHWMEESQHAQLDHLEALRIFRDMPEKDRDTAIEDLIWLLAAVDGLLQQQAVLDVSNLGRHLGRSFRAEEREEIRQGLLRTKRHGFIECGFTHLRFLELFHTVTTPAQQGRVQRALGLILRQSSVH